MFLNLINKSLCLKNDGELRIEGVGELKKYNIHAKKGRIDRQPASGFAACVKARAGTRF